MEYFSFHMMMNAKEMTQINNLLKTLNFSKKSLMINFILTESLDVIKDLYRRAENQESKKTESQNRRTDMRFQIKKKYYHQIKLIHGKKNTYSISNIIRLIITFFSEGIKIYGGVEKFLKKIKTLFNNSIIKKSYIKQFKKIHMDKTNIISAKLLKQLLLFLSKVLNC